jgi:hypothetical protein
MVPHPMRGNKSHLLYPVITMIGPISFESGFAMISKKLLEVHLRLQKNIDELGRLDKLTADIDSVSLETILSTTETLIEYKRLACIYLNLRGQHTLLKQDRVLQSIRILLEQKAVEVERLMQVVRFASEIVIIKPREEQKRELQPVLQVVGQEELGQGVLSQKAIRRKLARVHWGMLREHVLHQSTTQSEARQRLKVGTEYVGNTLDSMEATLLSHGQQRCEAHYQYLLKQHQRNIEWINFLIEVYEQAKNVVDTTLADIDQSYQKRQKAYRSIAMHIISMALSPLGLSGAAAPLIELLAVANKVKLEDVEYCARLFMTFMGKESKQKSLNDLAEQEFDPIELLEVTKKYCDYKIRGVAADARQLFNTEMPGNRLLGGVPPKQLVRDCLNRKLAEIKSNMSDTEWMLYCENDFRKLQKKLLVETEEELLNYVDQLFSHITAQYGQLDESVAYSELIDRIVFDEKQSGIGAYQKGLKQKLKHELAEIVEVAMFLDYGREQRKFLDDDKFSSKHKKQYALLPGYRSQRLVDEVIKRIEKDSEKRKALRKRLLKKERAKWALTKLGHSSFESQVERQEALDSLFKSYSHKTLLQKLQEKIISFAKRFNFLPKKSLKEKFSKKPKVDSSWQSEVVLLQTGKGVLQDLVDFSKDRKMLYRNEAIVLEELDFLVKIKAHLQKTLTQSTAPQLVVDKPREVKKKKKSSRCCFSFCLYRT